MERSGWLNRIALAVVTLAAVLFCIGGASTEVYAASQFMRVNGSDYYKSVTLTHKENRAIKTGYISYDASTHTITMNNVRLEASEQDALYVKHGSEVTIRLEGTNEITYSGKNLTGIYAESVDHTYIEGPGSITIDGAEYQGVRANDSLTIRNGATITVKCRDGQFKKFPTAGIWLDSGQLTIDSSVVYAEGQDEGIRCWADTWTDFGPHTIHDSTVTAKAYADDGLGMNILYRRYHVFDPNQYWGNALQVDGYSEVIISGKKAAISNLETGDGALIGNSLALGAGSGKFKYMMEAGDTASGPSTQQVQYDEYKEWCLKDTTFDRKFEDKYLGEWKYLHISAQETKDVQFEMTFNLADNVALPDSATITLRRQSGGLVTTDNAAPTVAINNGGLWEATLTGVLVRADADYVINDSDVVIQPSSGNYDYHISGSVSAGKYTIQVCGGTAEYVCADVNADWLLDAGASKPTIGVTLMLNGQKVGDEQFLNADDDWKTAFHNLYKANKDYYQLVVTTLPASYSATVTGDVETGYTVHVSGGGTGEAYAPAGECNHVYEWEVYKAATATDDGEMRYRCKYCGDVQYSVPVTAYYTFNKETQEKVIKAGQGATVKVQTPWFISFHEMVYKALQERPDVTLVVDYKNEDALYEMTIPAGNGDQLQSLFGDSQFAGFLYLGGTYATTELPKDTVFEGVSATEMWFGTTTAH